MKKNSHKKRALQHLMRARKLLAESRRAGRPHSEEELIARVRRTRSELWKSKLASRP